MKLVLATGNIGKVKELEQMLAETGLHETIEVFGQSAFGVSSVAETGLTFIENALIKARYASAQTGLPALADDSGLVVQALAGAPGIYSARYAGEHASDADNNQKLLAELQTQPQESRHAHFYCALAYMRHAKDPEPGIFHATWAGEILHAPRGTEGFGYDPLFYVPTEQCTAAELAKSRKNQLSHRAQAFYQFIAFLMQQ